MRYCRKPFQGYASHLPATGGGYGWHYCDQSAGHDSICQSTTGKIAERPVRTLGDEVEPPTDGRIKLDVWRKVVIDGAVTGYIDRERGRPIDEIGAELIAALNADDLIDEYFHVCSWLEHAQKEAVERDKRIVRSIFPHKGLVALEWTPPGNNGRPVYEDYPDREEAEARRDALLKIYRHPTPRLESAVDATGQYAGRRQRYLWPDGYRWISCFAVTGGSEGHYVHVDLIFDSEHTAVGYVRTPLSIFMGKTFRGMEHALKIAARCATLLGA